MFHLRPLGRRNKKVMKNKKTMTSTMTMEMKKSNQPHWPTSLFEAIMTLKGFLDVG
jgi:hypothetical protein